MVKDVGIVVVGVNGRMGRMLVRSVVEREGCFLAGAIGRVGSDYIGVDAGILSGIGACGVEVVSDSHGVIAGCDVVIDFSPPPDCGLYAELSAQSGCGYVCGSTGLDDSDWRVLEQASLHCAVVYGSNMSLGVNVLEELVRLGAERLSDDYDIEIYEMHHGGKLDSPSGTALSLGRSAALGRGIEHDSRMVVGRGAKGGGGSVGKGAGKNVGERRRGDIGYASLRGGSVVGEHRVTFAGIGESLELCHIAFDRGVFAFGAVSAALWVSGQGSGLYGMRDVLGL